VDDRGAGASPPIVLDLDGVHGFADLGGLPGTDGAVTRAGVVFRSAGLQRLTAAGRRTLAELGVTVRIDLRASFELRGGEPEHLGAGVQTLRLPLLDAHDAETYLRLLRMRLGAGRRRPLSPGAVARLAVGDGASAIASAFTAIAHAPAALFGCTTGQVRSAVLATVILRVAGVPSPAVVAAERTATGAEAARGTLEALADWGSAGGYLVAHGVAEQDLTTFQARFLTAPPRPAALPPRPRLVLPAAS
jgi:protein-tyrosine phosphatase